MDKAPRDNGWRRESTSRRSGILKDVAECLHPQCAQRIGMASARRTRNAAATWRRENAG